MNASASQIASIAGTALCPGFCNALGHVVGARGLGSASGFLPAGLEHLATGSGGIAVESRGLSRGLCTRAVNRVVMLITEETCPCWSRCWTRPWASHGTRTLFASFDLSSKQALVMSPSGTRSSPSFFEPVVALQNSVTTPLDREAYNMRPHTAHNPSTSWVLAPGPHCRIGLGSATKAGFIWGMMSSKGSEWPSKN